MDIFKLGDKILALLEAVFGFWNNQISLVFAMLGQSPVSFKGGGPWAVIEGIEPVFVAVGPSLVVLFFVIGFCSESIDVKDEMRFESILRMLIRLGLAEWFVANNVTIMKAFFTSIGNLVGLISAGTTTQLAIDSTQADIIKGLGFGESLVMLILTALLAIIIIICGFFIIYTVYFRFLKILIIVPLGAIACSTMAGNRMVSHTMATYCKYFLSCVFEAVTMALAIVVCNAFINAGLPAFTGSYADWAQTLIYLCEMTFTIAMTVGSVKGAQTLTSIYTVYFRFLKILIIVPLGAIACSTMAGNRMVSHTMATYCKYFLSCVFEAVTMALAIVVCNAFINAGLPAFTGSYADWAQTLIYLCEMTFTIAMTVGSVKGAQTLTSKAFGL